MWKKALFAIYVFLAVVFVKDSFAYSDTTTHPALTQEIIEFYNLSFPADPITSEQKEWIIQGSALEDTPPRWINHFYDPINKVGWTGEEAGKISPKAIRTASLLLSLEKPLSAVEWVKNDLIQEEYRSLGGNRSWQMGLDYYLDGDTKEFYITLGHVLHLLEDMGVPDHTRNDTHAEPVQNVTGDPGSPLEKYATRWNRDSIKNLAIPQSLIAVRTEMPAKNRIEDYLISMAEYSNKYFFSKDTIGKFELPQVVREDGNFGYGIDEGGNEFLLARVKEREISRFIFEKSYILEQNDEEILKAYFSRLSRQIVLRGAGVIELYKRQAKDRVENESFYQHDILRNRNSRSVSRFFTIPNPSVAGIVARVGDIGAAMVGALANAVRNVTSIIAAPVRNLAPEISERADLPPIPQSISPLPEIVNTASVADEDSVKTEENENEDVAQEKIVQDDLSGFSENTAKSDSALELAALQAQINEAARQVENLRQRVEAIAPQARFTRSNIRIFEEEEEQEEEVGIEPAKGRVFAATSGGGSSGGGGGGGSGGSNSSGASTDTFAPAAITNLAVLSVATSSITLSWTAPGDDGVSGTADSYTIRYATTTITAANWPSAINFASPPAPLAAGGSQSATLAGFTPGTTYYFAIKTKDEAGNESGLSNIASATTDLPIPDTSNVNHILISEAQVRGVSEGDEFIELYNPAESEIDISGWSIQYLSGAATSASSAVKKNFESGNKIGARSYFLIARGLNASSTDGYIGARTPDMSHRTFSLSGSASGATIFLVKNREIISGADDPDIVDRLAYGSGAGLLAETNPAALPPAGQSLERKAWVSGACASATGANEFSGNGCDTGVNSADFEIRSAPNPQNLANLPETRSAPAILNLQSFYSSSTMSADFSWTLSQDARGATSTNIYTISKITPTSTLELFRASSTSFFSTPISEATSFEFKAEDREGLSRSATTTITSSFYSYLGNIFEQNQRNLNIHIAPHGGSHYFAQTFTPQRAGTVNSLRLEFAPWNGIQILDGMASCSIGLYRANSPAAANEGNLLATSIFPIGSGSPSASGWPCVVGDPFSPNNFRLATTTLSAGETYTLIFNYRDATHPPNVWGSGDVIPGSLWFDGVERPTEDMHFSLSGIVMSDIMFTQPPTQPQNLRLNFDRYNLKLGLSWDAASDPDSGFHYQINYTTSTALAADGWRSVGASTTASIPLVYPNTYKVGVRSRDDFYYVSTSTVSDWSFPAGFTTNDALASQMDTNHGVVGGFGQGSGFKVEWGQTFTVATTSVPYSIRLNTAGVSGSSCSVKIYAVSSALDTVPSTDSRSPIAMTGTLGGGGSAACDASPSKTFHFTSTGILSPGTDYIWIYTVQDGSGLSNEIIGGYKETGYPGIFSYRHNGNPAAAGSFPQNYNAYFELFGDLAD